MKTPPSPDLQVFYGADQLSPKGAMSVGALRAGVGALTSAVELGRWLG